MLSNGYLPGELTDSTATGISCTTPKVLPVFPKEGLGGSKGLNIVQYMVGKCSVSYGFELNFIQESRCPEWSCSQDSSASVSEGGLNVVKLSCKFPMFRLPSTLAWL